VWIVEFGLDRLQLAVAENTILGPRERQEQDNGTFLALC
jgi:hypothetical protein